MWTIFVSTDFVGPFFCYCYCCRFFYARLKMVQYIHWGKTHKEQASCMCAIYNTFTTNTVFICARARVYCCIFATQYVINIWRPLLLKCQMVCAFHLTDFSGCLFTNGMWMFTLNIFHCQKMIPREILVVVAFHFGN